MPGTLHSHKLDIEERSIPYLVFSMFHINARYVRPRSVTNAGMSGRIFGLLFVSRQARAAVVRAYRGVIGELGMNEKLISASRVKILLTHSLMTMVSTIMDRD